MKLLKTERTKIVAEAVMLALGAAYLGSAWVNASLAPDWYWFAGILVCSCFVIWLAYQLGPVEKAPADSVKPGPSFYKPRYIRAMARIPRVTVYWMGAVFMFILLALLYEFLSRNPF